MLCDSCLRLLHRAALTLTDCTLEQWAEINPAHPWIAKPGIFVAEGHNQHTSMSFEPIHGTYVPILHIHATPMPS